MIRSVSPETCPQLWAQSAACEGVQPVSHETSPQFRATAKEECEENEEEEEEEEEHTVYEDDNNDHDKISSTKSIMIHN